MISRVPLSTCHVPFFRTLHLFLLRWALFPTKDGINPQAQEIDRLVQDLQQRRTDKESNLLFDDTSNLIPKNNAELSYLWECCRHAILLLPRLGGVERAIQLAERVFKMGKTSDASKLLSDYLELPVNIEIFLNFGANVYEAYTDYRYFHWYDRVVSIQMTIAQALRQNIPLNFINNQQTIFTEEKDGHKKWKIGFLKNRKFEKQILDEKEDQELISILEKRSDFTEENPFNIWECRQAIFNFVNRHGGVPIQPVFLNENASRNDWRYFLALAEALKQILCSPHSTHDQFRDAVGESTPRPKIVLLDKKPTIEQKVNVEQRQEILIVRKSTNEYEIGFMKNTKPQLSCFQGSHKKYMQEPPDIKDEQLIKKLQALNQNENKISEDTALEVYEWVMKKGGHSCIGEEHTTKINLAALVEYWIDVPCYKKIDQCHTALAEVFYQLHLNKQLLLRLHHMPLEVYWEKLKPKLRGKRALSIQKKIQHLIDGNNKKKQLEKDEREEQKTLLHCQELGRRNSYVTALAKDSKRVNNSYLEGSIDFHTEIDIALENIVISTENEFKYNEIKHESKNNDLDEKNKINENKPIPTFAETADEKRKLEFYQTAGSNLHAETGMEEYQKLYKSIHFAYSAVKMSNEIKIQDRTPYFFFSHLVKVFEHLLKEFLERSPLFSEIPNDSDSMKIIYESLKTYSNLLQSCCKLGQYLSQYELSNNIDSLFKPLEDVHRKFLRKYRLWKEQERDSKTVEKIGETFTILFQQCHNLGMSSFVYKSKILSEKKLENNSLYLPWCEKNYEKDSWLTIVSQWLSSLLPPPPCDFGPFVLQEEQKSQSYLKQFHLGIELDDDFFRDHHFFSHWAELLRICVTRFSKYEYDLDVNDVSLFSRAASSSYLLIGTVSELSKTSHLPKTHWLYRTTLITRIDAIDKPPLNLHRNLVAVDDKTYLKPYAVASNLQWQQRLKALTTPNPDKEATFLVKLYFPETKEEGYLKTSLVQRLFTEDEKSKSPVGTNLDVLKLTANDAEFLPELSCDAIIAYMKFNPKNPWLQSQHIKLAQRTFDYGFTGTIAELHYGKINNRNFESPKESSAITVWLSCPAGQVFRTEGKEKSIIPAKDIRIIGDEKIPNQFSLYENQLDRKYFTQAVFFTWLFSPQEDRLRNLGFQRFLNAQGKECSLINFVDTDSSLKKTSIRMPNGMIQINLKSFLFCLDTMRRPLDPDAVLEFRSLDIEVLLAWLTDVAKNESKQNSLSQGSLRGMFQRYQILQQVLQLQAKYAHPLVPFFPNDHLQLLELLDPLFGQAHHETFDKTNDPVERFNIISKGIRLQGTYTSQISGLFYSPSLLPSDIKDRDVISIEEGIAQIKKYQEQNAKKDTLKTYLTTEVQRTPFSKLFQKQLMIVFGDQKMPNDIKPLENTNPYFLTGLWDVTVRAPLLSEWDWSQFSQSQVANQRLLPLLELGKFTKLNLQSCWELTDTYVRALTKNSSGLVQINLSGCNKITGNMIIKLLQFSTSLTRFSARGLPKLTGLYSGAISKPVLAAQLIYADFRGCDQLTHVSLQAPALKYLQLDDCKLLTELLILDSKKLQELSLKRCSSIAHLQIKSKSLEKLDVEGANLLTLAVLKKALSQANWANVRELKGCDPFTKWKLLGTYPFLIHFEMSLARKYTSQEQLDELDAIFNDTKTRRSLFSLPKTKHSFLQRGISFFLFVKRLNNRDKLPLNKFKVHDRSETTDEKKEEKYTSHLALPEKYHFENTLQYLRNLKMCNISDKMLNEIYEFIRPLLQHPVQFNFITPYPRRVIFYQKILLHYEALLALEKIITKFEETQAMILITECNPDFLYDTLEEVPLEKNFRQLKVKAQIALFNIFFIGYHINPDLTLHDYISRILSILTKNEVVQSLSETNQAQHDKAETTASLSTLKDAISSGLLVFQSAPLIQIEEETPTTAPTPMPTSISSLTRSIG